MSQLKFRLDPTQSYRSGSQHPPATSSISATTFTIPGYSSIYQNTLDATKPSKPVRGSLEDDKATLYTLSWPSMTAMSAWKRAEEQKNSIEFCRKEVRRNKAEGLKVWHEKHIFVCARKGSGGNNGQHYVKKHDRTRKIESKRTDCECRLTVKTYPGTDTVLGLYQATHDHPIGYENARFTRLPDETRAEIERLLRLGVDPKTVVSDHILSSILSIP